MLAHSSPIQHIYSDKLYFFKDVLMGIPKSDLLGVTVALIHVAGQRFLAVQNGVVPCQF